MIEASFFVLIQKIHAKIHLDMDDSYVKTSQDVVPGKDMKGSDSPSREMRRGFAISFN